MKMKSVAFSLLLFLMAFVVFTTNGCHGVYLNESQAALEVSQSKIKVGVFKESQQRSLDDELLQSFIKDYELTAEVIVFKTYQSLQTAFLNKELDLVVVRSSSRNYNLSALQGPAYEDLQLGLFCRNENISQILLPQIHSLQAQELLQKYPELKDKVVFVDQSLEKTIQQSYQLKNSCFIAELRHQQNLLLQQYKYQRVWTTETIYPLSWFISPTRASLNKLVHIWFGNLIRDNKMMRFKDQFDSQLHEMSLLEYKRFKQDVQTKLPLWKKHFEVFANKYNIPWTLIAAVAYQESKWNSEAESHTGVKGFMQLTAQTAEHLGVQDRNDPLQSIQGGSYYLKYLFDKTPEKLTSFERWIQALAAYNMGWAHLKDIHKLASERSINAYRWKHLKELLPEKANEENLESFQFGLARGFETVDFIEKVLKYNEALNLIFKASLNNNQLIHPWNNSLNSPLQSSTKKPTLISQN